MTATVRAIVSLPLIVGFVCWVAYYVRRRGEEIDTTHVSDKVRARYL